MAVYYVSISGNDSNDGLSPATAWQTLGHVSDQSYSAGDQILLEGGSTFIGQLSLDAANSFGTALNPIVINSYGSGRATINNTVSPGIYVYNAAGIEIRNLIFDGGDTSTTVYNSFDDSAIYFYRDINNAGWAEHIVVDSVEVSGFVWGVQFGADNFGFDDIRVTNCVVHDSRDGGVLCWSNGFSPTVHTNVYFGNLHCYNHPGRPGGGTPVAISVGAANGYVVENCTVHDVGVLNDNSYGAVGIGGYDSQNGIIQHNLAYDIKTSGTTDGVAFNFDVGEQNSIMQYNLAYNCYGSGYLLYAGADDPQSGCIVRYNVSWNNARKLAHYGEMLVSGSVSSAKIYNNTMIATDNATGSPGTVMLMNGVSDIKFYNNLLINLGAGHVVSAPSAYNTATVLFQGNAYRNTSGATTFKWGSPTYSSLATWQAATNQEKIGATPVGTTADPLLVDVTAQPAITAASYIRSITNVMLQPGSPMIGAGLDLQSAFSIDPGDFDYFGQSLALPPSIGAHQPSRIAGWVIGIIPMGVI